MDSHHQFMHICYNSLLCIEYYIMHFTMESRAHSALKLIELGIALYTGHMHALVLV